MSKTFDPFGESMLSDLPGGDLILRGIEELASGDIPFGLTTNFSDYARDAVPKHGQLRLYANVATTRVRGAMARKTISKNSHLIDVWKLFLPVLDNAEGRTYAQAIAQTLAAKALAGDIHAAQELADRAQGKPRQSLEINTLDCARRSSA